MNTPEPAATTTSQATPQRYRIRLIGGLLLIAAGLALAWFLWLRPVVVAPNGFDGARAYQDVLAQSSFGPRVVGTQAHAKVIQYIETQLAVSGWQAETRESTVMSHPVQNIVATRNTLTPKIILGAHYDSRMFADQDPTPDNRRTPVPGADDGASGVAVLLELARSLPANSIPVQLVFFDAEDNGNIPGWDWSLGATAFVQNLSFTPEAVVVVDMVGDADLNIYREGNSTPQLTDQIWQQASALGYGNYFIPEQHYYIIDDHTPFLKKGLPAVDIIDIDYPYWHTVQDTPDKVSAKSLKIVGDTLLAWIKARSQ